MKKTYRKPQIIFDSFELSQNIAGNCATISNMQRQVCPVEDPELGITFFSGTGCDMEPAPGVVLCYEVPAADTNVFTS